MDRPEPHWFDEIDLDPSAEWLRMGTRNLGRRPWLVVDDRRRAELALKARLLAERHEEVLQVESGPEAEAAGRSTLALVEADLVARGVAIDRADGGPMGETELHPLDRAGRLVQEDLCLMRRDPDTWVLAGGSLCFPSRWRLIDKMGLPTTEVHGPVVGYRSELAARVDHLFDRLADGAVDRIVWRRNWFVHPDPELHQPDRPPTGDPILPAADCLDGLFLRSERQTLRRLDPDGWILFTIRIQQEPLSAFVADPERRRALIEWLRAAPPPQQAHRGVAPEQATELLAALGSTS